MRLISAKGISRKTSIAQCLKNLCSFDLVVGGGGGVASRQYPLFGAPLPNYNFFTLPLVFGN
jgi:hypothetical protein